jgi:hypothetical protein
MSLAHLAVKRNTNRNVRKEVAMNAKKLIDKLCNKKTLIELSG